MICRETPAQDGLRLARRFAYHPSVTSVRWSPVARSLTIHFESQREFSELLEELPDDAWLPAPVTVVKPAQFSIVRLGALFLDVFSGNPLAIAQGLLNALPAPSTAIR
jgi:hypothetical protein